MRRAIGVWGFWFSNLLLLTLLTLWAASYFIDRSQSCIALGYRCFALLRNGRIDLASDLDTNSGGPEPLVVNPRSIIFPRVVRSGGVTVPGFELHFCSLDGGNALWSLKMSLLIPLAVSLFCVALLFQRLRRRRVRVATIRTDGS